LHSPANAARSRFQVHIDSRTANNGKFMQTCLCYWGSRRKGRCQQSAAHKSKMLFCLSPWPFLSAAMQLNMKIKKKRGKEKVENHGSGASNNNFHPAKESEMGKKESETSLRFYRSLK